MKEAEVQLVLLGVHFSCRGWPQVAAGMASTPVGVVLGALQQLDEVQVEIDRLAGVLATHA